MFGYSCRLGTSPTSLYSRSKKRSSSLQRQELLQIIQANMEKNNLCFKTSRLATFTTVFIMVTVLLDSERVLTFVIWLFHSITKDWSTSLCNVPARGGEGEGVERVVIN